MPVPPVEPIFSAVQPDSGADIPTVNQRVRRVRRIRAETVPIRYRAISLHACGGVGEVYRAQDAELDREVALKQLQPDGASDPDGQARFIREARITGRLQHPGIIPVYGLVHDSLGRPSYAMRFVEGESLAAAIARAYAGRPSPTESPPSLRHLLTRFVAVCNAVAYAHSKGVVHRDLKPANVMLGPFGETYVVDWGLAKDTASGGHPAASGFGIEPGDTSLPLAENATQQGEVIGTPAFMSPEQAAGRWDEVGPAADIYSLGATLYNLLTGSAPYTGSISEGVLERVRAGKFLQPRDLRADVPPALEAICLRAMVNCPADRYPSALELAGEVERWLADEPVHAFVEPWSTRLSRWLRRRRTLVGSSAAAGMVAVVSLTLATILLSAANRREQTARQAADQQSKATQAERDEVARQRDRVNDRFLLARDAVAAILTNPGLRDLRSIPQAEPARRKLLETALKFHEEFIRRAAGDPTVREDAAFAYFNAGELERNLGRPEVAIQQYRQAIALLREIEAIHPSAGLVRTTLARIYNNLAIVQTDIRQFDASERSLRTCIEWTRAIVDADPRPQAPRADLARHLNNLASLQSKMKQFAAAEESLKATLKLGAELLAEDPRTLAYQLDQSRHYRVYGVLLRETGRFTEAETEFRRSLELAEVIAKENPNDLDSRLDVSGARIDLGRLLAARHRPTEAEPLLRASLAGFRSVAHDFPYVASNHRDVAQPLRDLGEVLEATGRRTEARAAFREAAESDEKAPQVEPSSVWVAIDTAGRLCDYGVQLENDHDLPGAILWLGKAAKLLEDALRRDGSNVTGKRFLINTYWNRARCLVNSLRDKEAIADWTRVTELDDGSFRRDAFPALAWANVRLGNAAGVAAAAEGGLAVQRDPEMRFSLACVLAIAADLASARPAESDRYAARTVAVLRELKAAPILQRPNVRDGLEADITFRVVRRRADFQALWAELKAARAPKP